MLTIDEELAINKAAIKCHNNSFAHGFWDGEDNEFTTPTKLMLIVSEVAEAMEGDRNGIPVNEKGGLGEELADIVIRVFDLARHNSIAIGTEIARKMEVNAGRPRMHGNKKY